jgi:hypothetical protein
MHFDLDTSCAAKINHRTSARLGKTYMDTGRKIVTRSPHRRSGIIPCPWLQSEPIEYESLLERDFVRLALFSPDLVSIRSQPFRIDLGELGTYTPDFLLTYAKSYRLVVEVKPAVYSETEKYQKLFSAAAGTMNASGITFATASDTQIGRNDRSDRAAVLLRYARSDFSPVDVHRTLLHANSCPDGVSISDLAAHTKVSRELVLHLIGQRKLFIDHQLDASGNQTVKPITKGNGNGYLHPAAWLGCTNWTSSL